MLLAWSLVASRAIVMELIGVISAALATWALLQVLIPLLQQRLLDLPNARSAHRRPTPRGGGMSFVLVAVAVSSLSLLLGGWSTSAWLPLLALPLALVGLLDDRLDLPAVWRYGVQLFTAILMLGLSPLVLSLTGPSLLALPVLLIAVTAVINFTNFMDGLDGLVAGCMAVALSAAALRSQDPAAIWAIVGGLLGFLVWNWSPAKVFMGDVGSTFLGAVFAALVLQASSWSEALGLLLVATPLLADACLCVPRRWLAGQPVLQAHRLHLFQRLHQAGWSHARVAKLYIAGTALLAFALLLGGWPWVVTLAALELLLGVWLDQRVALPFAE
jgi:UDP-N-acetylmuramyl pentapeptide phosphotransferase/UDP-N-acetylglucosamine-1-phosphate transferase